MFHTICSRQNICERQIIQYVDCLKDKKKKEYCKDFFFELYSCFNNHSLLKRIQTENNQVPSFFYKHTEPLQKNNH